MNLTEEQKKIVEKSRSLAKAIEREGQFYRNRIVDLAAKGEWGCIEEIAEEVSRAHSSLFPKKEAEPTPKAEPKLTEEHQAMLDRAQYRAQQIKAYADCALLLLENRRNGDGLAELAGQIDKVFAGVCDALLGVVRGEPSAKESTPATEPAPQESNWDQTLELAMQGKFHYRAHLVQFADVISRTSHLESPALAEFREQAIRQIFEILIKKN